MSDLKQSTAVTIKLGPFRDATDGDTAMTSLTIQKADVRLSKNGGNYAAAAADQGASDAGAPHDELGEYDISLGTGDTDTLGRLRVIVHKTGALVVWRDFMVLPANAWDSLYGSDKLEVDLVQAGGTNITASGGRPEVNTSHAAGTAWNSGAIGASTLASDTITADKIAANAIGASELASDAVSEIQSGLATASAVSALDTKVGTPVDLDDAGASVSDNLVTVYNRVNLVKNVTDTLEDVATDIAALPTAAEVNAEVVDALTTDIIADSVPDDGDRPSIAQALYMITQFLTERSVSGTTLTVTKPDGSTALMTFTLDDAETPTSITRAT